MVDSIIQGFDIWINAQELKSQGRLKTIDNISLEGIEKLRHLILGLSLSGKFSDNNIKLSDNIEQEIYDAQISYFKSIGKKVKDYNFGPPLLQEFSLPEGWRWMRIGELCDLQTGATPSTLKSEYYGGEIKWLVSGDINKRVIHECEGRITREGLKNSNCKILPKDTVLIALNGQGKTRASVALLKVESTCNQSLVGIIPFSSNILDSEFLLLSLHYRYYEIRDITGQKQRRGLNMGLVNELSVPLPPLAEQHRILSKVDELMALCDKLEEQQTNNLKTHQILVKTLLDTLTQAKDYIELQSAWESMAAHFDTLFCTEDSIEQLKQTIMQLAVMGKLVKQDPNDESVSELLKKIAKEKEKLVKEGIIKRQKPLPEIGEVEKPFNLPYGWKFERLSNFCELITKGSSPNWQGVAYTENKLDVLFITSENVGSYKLLLDKRKYVEHKFNEIEPRSILKRGDFLMNIVGASIGRTAIYNIDDLANINQAVCLIRAFTQFLNDTFLLHFFNSELCLSYMFDMQVDNARANLSMSNISKFIIPIPPLSEQHRIVAKVSELFAVCDTLKSNILKAEEIRVQLAEAVVESATA